MPAWLSSPVELVVHVAGDAPYPGLATTDRGPGDRRRRTDHEPYP